MSLDFPSNPATGDIYDAGTAKWRWTGAAWARVERVYPKVTFEDFGFVEGGTVDQAIVQAAASGNSEVWATEGVVYTLASAQSLRNISNITLHFDGATLKMGDTAEAALRFYDYNNVYLDFGKTGKFIGNYTAAGAWVSHATTPGITNGDGTGNAAAAYLAGVSTITINNLGVGYVKKGYRFEHVYSGTTYPYIVTADAAITAGTATITLNRGLVQPISNGQQVYLKFWPNRMVVASAVGPTDTTITLECANVTSAAGTPRIMAGDEFSFHTSYNDIDQIDYTKVCKVAPTGPVVAYNMTGTYPTMTVTVPLTEALGRSIAAGTMITSIQDHRNNRFLPVLFYGGTRGGVRGAIMSELRVHGFGQACIHAPWDGVVPSTKPNIDLVFEDNVDTSTDARGAAFVTAWSTRGLTVCGNRGTYALGQLRSLVQVERSQVFKVKANSQYGGQYLCNINGECADGEVSGNRGTHTMRMLRQGNTSTRLSFTRNIGIAHSSYTDWLMMVWSGMVDEDGAAAGNTALRLNSTTVGENEFSGATRTAGGYGSHIIIGPQNLDATLGETYWPRQVWVFGNRSTGATVHGIYGLNGDSVTYETNFVIGSGQAGINLVGGDNSDLLSNEVLDCCVDTPGKGIVLDGATNVKANGNKTTVDTGTGMEAGLEMINGATLRGEAVNDWTGTVTSGGLSLMAKQSRADLAALAAYGWRAASGQIVRAGDLDYIGSTGATALPSLPGLLPKGPVRPEHGGAGTDLASHQAAQDAAAITGAPILISQPAVLSGAITEGSNYRLRETTNQITWASTTDASRAMPGLADASLANSYPKIINFQDASDDNAGAVFVSFRAKASGSTTAFEKDALMVIARSEDPSTGTENGGVGTSINRDVVGIGGRAYVHAGNMAGRVWGMNAYARVSPGAQGRACGIEVDVDNDTGDAVTDMNAAFLKQGVHIVSKSGLVGVGAQINSGGADGFARGFVVRSAAINATHGISAFEYQGKWLIDKDGHMSMGGTIEAAAIGSLRSEAVTTIAAGYVPDANRVYTIGGLGYIGYTGATALPGLSGLLPYGESRPEHGGTGTDLASHQAAQDASVLTGAPILISQPAVLSGSVSEGTDYRLRKQTGPVAWASSTDASRAFPGIADATLPAKFAEVINWKTARTDGGGTLFVSTRAMATASVADYEKDGILSIAISSDPSAGTANGGSGTNINRDAVGIGARGYIQSGNTAGRVWGLNAYVYVPSGAEGIAQAIEVNVDHAASVVTDFSLPFQKNGINITTKNLAGTFGVVVNKGTGNGWVYGFAVDSNALDTTDGKSAFEYRSFWRVSKAGDMFVGKATGAETETGIALMQANGAVTITRNGNIGTTKFIRGDTLAATGTLWNLGTYGYSDAGTQREFSRISHSASAVTDGAESGTVWFYSRQAGTLTEQLRLGGPTGGVAIGSTAAAPGAGNVNLSGEYRVAGTKVIGTRKTGWAVATGTATRTAFDTATVTLPQLAERVKALIDDLHATAGHGLIGT